MKVASSHDEIKWDIKVNGPVIVGLVLYDDFLNYESGIYRNIAGEVVGGHAMKMIGWGYDEVEGLFLSFKINGHRTGARRASSELQLVKSGSIPYR